VSERVVLCHGVWDVLHAGHVSHLEAARALGDRLIVSVTPDRHVQAQKGLDRPYNTIEDRMRVLRALRCVDGVVALDSECGCRAIETVRPAVYVKGREYCSALADAEAIVGTAELMFHDPNVPHIYWDKVSAERVGCEFVFSDSMLGSSTRLIQAMRTPLTPPAPTF
jgi:rfaE bifunctional protein nucleotidyltransferase chain/domain